MTLFDVTKLPREEWLRRLFPDQDVRPDGQGIRRVHCRIPGCTHVRGDVIPSLDFDPDTGFHKCHSGNGEKAIGTGWKALVLRVWGEDEWKRGCGSKGGKLTLQDRWELLQPETAKTRRYGISPMLSQRHLRSGHRYPKDPRSETVIGVWQGGQLRAIKARLPEGERWQVGVMATKDPTAKYAWVKGSKAANYLFLGDLLEQRPQATVLICGGEVDALVAASHLPASWAPVSFCVGEGAAPSQEVLRHLVGRDVVVAYDGDPPGHEGAFKLWSILAGATTSCRLAQLPTDSHPDHPDKPGWDVSELVEARGRDGLLEVLKAAGDPPAGWTCKLGQKELELAEQLARCSPPSPPGPPPEEPPPADDVPPEGPAPEGAVSDWCVHQGVICQRVYTKAGPRYKAKFRGSIRITRHEESRVDGDDGWTSRGETTYRFHPAGGSPLVETVEEGMRPFRELLGRTRIAAACEALSAQDQVRLHAWVTRQLDEKDVVHRVEACGAHPGKGFFSSPDLLVHGGKVEQTSYQIGPPTKHAEFDRYGLAVIDDAAFKATASWILGTLLRCDHADQAYTLPLLGAVVGAPLWSYLPTLQQWQRYVFFVQGLSGSGKTTLARYFMSFWGDFTTSQDGLAAWGSTSTTSIRRLLYFASGLPVLVSDWKPANFTDQREYRDALRVVQSYADRSGRGTAAGGRDQKKLPPRCGLIMEGEDLPQGQQSTLGRMVILHVQGHPALCANANPQSLDPAMVAQLPGVSARWVAWIQQNVKRADNTLRELELTMDSELQHLGSNRQRIARNYAAQIASVRLFGEFLEEEAGLAGVADQLHGRSLEVHVAQADGQLQEVHGQDCGTIFLRQLATLLRSHQVRLRAKRGYDQLPDPFGFPDHGNNVPVVGIHDEQLRAQIDFDAAIPLVRRHVSSSGGLEFSTQAIEQSLRRAEVIKANRRVRGGAGMSKKRPWCWEIDLEDLGVEEGVRQQLVFGETDA